MSSTLVPTPEVSLTSVPESLGFCDHWAACWLLYSHGWGLTHRASPCVLACPAGSHGNRPPYRHLACYKGPFQRGSGSRLARWGLSLGLAAPLSVPSTGQSRHSTPPIQKCRRTWWGSEWQDPTPGENWGGHGFCGRIWKTTYCRGDGLWESGWLQGVVSVPAEEQVGITRSACSWHHLRGCTHWWWQRPPLTMGAKWQRRDEGKSHWR